jgi:hypothetical protein
MSFIENTVSNDVPPPMGAMEVSDDWLECACSECRKSDELKALMKNHYDNAGPNDVFDDDQYVLCPPRFLGHSMQRKRWIQIPVNEVQEFEKRIRTNEFGKLILEHNQKQLIKSLVANHEKKKILENCERAGADDWIEGKGGGLVILLHGTLPSPL